MSGYFCNSQSEKYHFLTIMQRKNIGRNKQYAIRSGPYTTSKMKKQFFFDNPTHSVLFIKCKTVAEVNW